MALVLAAGMAMGSPLAASAELEPIYREVYIYAGGVGAFNDHRQVIGVLNVGPPPHTYANHPFLWEDGTITDIGDAVGAVSFSNATDINEMGWIIGAVSASSHRSYLWRDGTVTNLDTMEDSTFWPQAVNDRGRIVGYGDRPDGDHGFLWYRGTFTDLGMFDALDINNNGDVVGYLSTVGTSPRAVRWSHGMLTDLNVPGVMSTATEINDRGEILGWYQDDTGTSRSFLWRSGRIVELGTLGGQLTMATGLNDRGQVTGYSETADGATHPFLWERGRMTDLVTRGVGPYASEVLINNRGDLLVNAHVLYLRG